MATQLEPEEHASGDLISDGGHLFLATRMKRLAERIQADALTVCMGAGSVIQPSQCALLIALEHGEAATVTSLTHALGQSQPTVTRAVTRLVRSGLVETSTPDHDQRQRTVRLTPAGHAAVANARTQIWPQVEAAAAELTADLSGSFLDQLAQIEVRLAERPLHARGKAAAPAPSDRLSIVEYRDDLAQAFRDINAEWITAMYSLEPTDADVLDHPRKRIIDGGGAILFVEDATLGLVGACALQKTGPRDFELTKMGVLERARGRKLERARGRKAGEFLLRAVIERALQMGAQNLYLLSNKKSAAAIHLYEKLGFVHDRATMAANGARYARCNVAMRYRPPPAA